MRANIALVCLNILIIAFASPSAASSSNCRSASAIRLQSSVVIDQGVDLYSSQCRLHLYCTERLAGSLAWSNAFASASMQIESHGDATTPSIFLAATEELVKERHGDESATSLLTRYLLPLPSRLWRFLMSAFSSAAAGSGNADTPTRIDYLSLDPFNSTCVGIDSEASFRVIYRVERVTLWRLAVFLLAIVAHCNARRLAPSEHFQYGSSAGFGVFFFLLLALYFVMQLARLRRTMTITTLAYAIGGSCWLWLTTTVLGGVGSMLANHPYLFGGYLAVSALLGFAYGFYRGPIREERGVTLIRWAIRLLADTAIFMSSGVAGLAFLVIIALYLRDSIAFWPRVVGLRRLYYRLFPLGNRLLTEQEFEDEGRRETAKALSQLRRQLSTTPNWRQIDRLREPKYVARFVLGERGHVSAEEEHLHDQLANNAAMSDVSSSDIDSDEDGGDDDGLADFLPANRGREFPASASFLRNHEAVPSSRRRHVEATRAEVPSSSSATRRQLFDDDDVDGHYRISRYQSATRHRDMDIPTSARRVRANGFSRRH